MSEKNVCFSLQRNVNISVPNSDLDDTERSFCFISPIVQQEMKSGNNQPIKKIGIYLHEPFGCLHF